jgi:cytochrome c peroxidase
MIPSIRTVTAAATLAAACAPTPTEPPPWTAAEREELRALWIGSLPELPADPSNLWADDPAAAALGHRLFFDSRLSANGRVSCATCHRPELEFQDGEALATGIGMTSRRTMPIAATAYSPWQFWDGRSDSQWAQALGPLENPVEHGVNRTFVVQVVARHYGAEYDAVFGPMPVLEGVPAAAASVVEPAAIRAWQTMAAARQEAVTKAFVNVGKAIAAYERRIGYGPSRFDRYVELLLRDGTPPSGVLSAEEIAGLRLFIGKAGCTQCHNGPLLTNHDFHNTGVPEAAGLPRDRGRAAGVSEVLEAEFSCRSRYSDAGGRCPELDFINHAAQSERGFKVPSLRNVAERAPYMHAGQLGSLEEVIAHYSTAPAAPSGHSELRPLQLTPQERTQLVSYLRSLSGPLAADPQFLRPPR